MDIFLLCKYLATLGFIGYLPAPGTLASFCTLWFIYGMQNYIFNGWFLLALLTSGYLIIYYARRYFHNQDSACIVFDEVIGMIVTFFYMPMALTVPWLLVGFFFFRFFDITKLGYASWERTWTTTTGILMDDIIAGLCSNVLLRGIHWILTYYL